MASKALNGIRLPLALTSWVCFAIALTIYWITCDPGVSYWDCPEYVAVASKMDIGHPPGNPVWTLAMRVATIPFPSGSHAFIINHCSGLFMAFAVFFLCRIIFSAVWLSLKKYVARNKIKQPEADIISGLTALGASLCFAFCDSVWYSAVEAEVYALSAFLSSLSLWIMGLWWIEKEKGRRKRLLILLCYLTGISLGVHQLNLLLIPVFALIVYYRYRPERKNLFSVLTVVVSGFLFVGLILLVLIPGSLQMAGNAELLAVNRFGLPYDSGVLIFIFLILLLLIASVVFTGFQNNRTSYSGFRSGLNVASWMIFFLFIGFSSYALIAIRSNAYPPMNQGVADNIFSLKSYIEREQYPSTPLIYGQTPYSRPLFVEEFQDGKPVYSRYILEKGSPKYLPFAEDASLYPRSGMLSSKDSTENIKTLESRHGYLLTDYIFKQKLTPELDMWFPRITSSNPSDLEAYEGWAGMNLENMDRVAVSETMDSAGKYVPRAEVSGLRPTVYSYRPTYLQHLKYFISYQSYYMYFRYLFWNFIGRQNDFPSTGEIEHGNFITGINFIDSNLIGETEFTPAEIGSENKGRNVYYAIPFVFGIAGIIFLAVGSRKSRRVLAVITLLFLMTGMAIVVYLNQTPGEPRERDYTFLVSYMAFAMWIGAGFLAFFLGLIKLKGIRRMAVAATALVSLFPATLMAIENFDDHDRRNRYETSFFISSLTDFELPSIIFTHGDNFTFPMWYATEVLEQGKDHTPVDVTYLSLPSYVINMKKQGKRGVGTTLLSPRLAYGALLITKIPEPDETHLVSLDALFESVSQTYEGMPELPASHIKLPSSQGDSVLINLRDFTSGSSYLSFRHLILLDMIAAQLKSDEPKALYFPNSVGRTFFKALEPVLYPTLFGRIYAPWLAPSKIDSITSRAARREMAKLEALEIKPHYADPLIQDMTRRYRGELLLGARQLLEMGDTATSMEMVEMVSEKYPYTTLLPGDFTIADSTFYEGKEYSRLLQKFYESTGKERFKNKKKDIDSLMGERNREWLKYYNSLTPSQRKTLSNRSKRLLLK